MKIDYLKTERLKLMILTPEVYDYLFTKSTDTEIMQVLALATIDELLTEKERYKKGMTSYRTSFCHFLMLDKLSTRRIGFIGYHTWQPKHNRAEIGYNIDGEADKNKGYMKEALNAVLKYGFGKMNLHRVEAFVGPNNRASIRLVESAGFQCEGQLREHYLVDGEYQDSLCYGLLATAYKNPEHKL